MSGRMSTSSARFGGGQGTVRKGASGGIRDLDTAIEMIDAGADRLGTSIGASIVDEARRRDV